MIEKSNKKITKGKKLLSLILVTAIFALSTSSLKQTLALNSGNNTYKNSSYQSPKVKEKYQYVSGPCWAFASIAAKYPEKCLSYMEGRENHLDDWTFNKTIQKSCESFRVSNDVKEKMKSLRRR